MSIHQPPESKPVEPPAERGAVPLPALLKQQTVKVPEIGGRSDGPEPTRYGDWEKNGRCIDF
ncbi:MAG: DUF1674 domain-containing protein [Hydrocarboniphaga effusa]|nr:DUF1674 domain-containing protein [Hydrocarboniphaga effusa]